MIEDIEWGQEIGFGVTIGLIFIVLNAAFGLVIGIPLLVASPQTEKIVITDTIAPIGEELAFRMLLPFLLVIIGVPLIINGLINIIIFPIFHYVVYGESFTAASNLFIGAGLFALVAFLVTYYKSDADDIQVPVAAIIAHMMINTWLGIKLAKLVVAPFIGIN